MLRLPEVRPKCPYSYQHPSISDRPRTLASRRYDFCEYFGILLFRISPVDVNTLLGQLLSAGRERGPVDVSTLLGQLLSAGRDGGPVDVGTLPMLTSCGGPCRRPGNQNIRSNRKKSICETICKKVAFRSPPNDNPRGSAAEAAGLRNPPTPRGSGARGARGWLRSPW